MYSEVTPRGRPRRARNDEDDGDVPMAEPHDGPRGRYVPYAPRSGRLANINITVKREPGERGGGSGRDGRRSWFKITIPYGKKYDKSWLLSSIQNLCSVPFTPVEVSEGTRGVVIVINSSAPPQSLQNELKPEEVEQLKLCMSKRYDGAQKSLDLKSLRVDPDLVSQGIDVVLNQRSSMGVVLRIIEENIPELQSLTLGSNRLFRLDDLAELPLKVPGLKVLDLSRNELKSERELDKLKGLKLEELWLDGNPLCDSFRDQSSYISSIRERFPKLLRLDGHELPPPIAFDVEAPTTLPPCKVGPPPILGEFPFLPRYYSVYDSSDRQGLLDAYHDGACCSLSIPYGPHTPPRCLDTPKQPQKRPRTPRNNLKKSPRAAGDAGGLRLQSGMNLECSQKCLQDNDWDYGQAGQVFTQLKLEGKIPEVAFLK
ncbi:hypothetical protein HGM15179_020011 [Zosterops borbonicus]|uniref:TAP-C domain-containing protein n=1 Tax=Zosterops borbonicus TaxID=364589 RepID=A0A8K1D8V3_9PASS|nr:hypothetical protein HGM15179_020011 [Zosterops borbonicus]